MSSERVRQLQSDVDHWMRDSKELTDKQRRYMEDSRKVGEELQAVNTKLTQRQHELMEAMRQDAEDARRKQEEERHRSH